MVSKTGLYSVKRGLHGVKTGLHGVKRGQHSVKRGLYSVKRGANLPKWGLHTLLQSLKRAPDTPSILSPHQLSHLWRGASI